jgi:hypothetical protein
VKWVMRNGEKIALRDMGTSHIKNCIAMLRRADARDIRRLVTASAFVNTLNGEMATYFAEQEMDRLADALLGDSIAREWWVKRFETELKRRGDAT